MVDNITNHNNTKHFTDKHLTPNPTTTEVHDNLCAKFSVVFCQR